MTAATYNPFRSATFGFLLLQPIAVAIGGLLVRRAIVYIAVTRAHVRWCCDVASTVG